MTPVIIVVAVVAVAVLVAAVILMRRRRTAPGEIKRDQPTVEVAAQPRGFEGGLAKTRRALGDRLGTLFRRTLDDEFWSELEEVLIGADIGVSASVALTERVRADDPQTPDEARAALRRELAAMLADADREIAGGGDPTVIVVVGVNGSGKTTTIAKLGARIERDGGSVLLGAADTFRAAAAEQLSTWASRLGIDIVAGSPGADPAAVAFDALSAAAARGKSTVVVDTAGRLHSKKNLMEELGKVVRVLGREAGSVHEVLLVLDGTTGQNGIVQARSFTEAVGVTGIVITKLDGTAKGGIAVAVEQDLGVPVKFVGVGEAVEDLIPFDPPAFVDALLGNES